MASGVVCRDCDNAVNGVTYWLHRMVHAVPAIDAGENLNQHAYIKVFES